MNRSGICAVGVLAAALSAAAVSAAPPAAANAIGADRLLKCRPDAGYTCAAGACERDTVSRDAEVFTYAPDRSRPVLTACRWSACFEGAPRVQAHEGGLQLQAALARDGVPSAAPRVQLSMRVHGDGRFRARWSGEAPGASMLHGRCEMHPVPATPSDPDEPLNALAAAVAFRDAADACGANGACLEGVAARLERAAADARGQDAQAYDFARGWLDYRAGRLDEAAARLEGITGYLHHTLAIPGLFHDALGDVYAAQGRDDAAQGQWRLARAADWNPLVALWTPAGATQKLQASTPARLVPLHLSGHSASIIDLGSVRRQDGVVGYRWLQLRAEPRADGMHYAVVEQEVRCASGTGRQRSATLHGAQGSVIATEGANDWHRAGSALAASEWTLACSLDGPVAADSPADYAAALQQYRAHRATH